MARLVRRHDLHTPAPIRTWPPLPVPVRTIITQRVAASVMPALTSCAVTALKRARAASCGFGLLGGSISTLTAPWAASAISCEHLLQRGPPPLLYALPNQLSCEIELASSSVVSSLKPIWTLCLMSLRRRV